MLDPIALSVLSLTLPGPFGGSALASTHGPILDPHLTLSALQPPHELLVIVCIMAEPPIDLLCGWPNPALLPAPELLRSATVVLTTPSIANPGLLYGPDEGYGPLRAHVASWLSAFYRPCHPVTAERICITGGASQNLACVLQVFTDPVYTRNVWTVDPTYHLAGRMLDDAGFAGRVHGIPEDNEGIDLDFLAKELCAAEKRADEEDNKEPVSQMIALALRRRLQAT